MDDAIGAFHLQWNELQPKMRETCTFKHSVPVDNKILTQSLTKIEHLLPPPCLTCSAGNFLSCHSVTPDTEPKHRKR